MTKYENPSLRRGDGYSAGQATTDLVCQAWRCRMVNDPSFQERIRKQAERFGLDLRVMDFILHGDSFDGHFDYNDLVVLATVTDVGADFEIRAD